MPLKFWMDISTKDLMLIIVLIEKKVPYFLFVFCIKKLKLVDMLGILVVGATWSIIIILAFLCNYKCSDVMKQYVYVIMV